MKDKIIIQWLGHSCFKLTFGHWQCVVDPYEDGQCAGAWKYKGERHGGVCQPRTS